MAQREPNPEDVAEYVDTSDDAAFGAATSVEPKYVSPVDPVTCWSAADHGKAHVLNSTDDLVDLGNAIIVDSKPTSPSDKLRLKPSAI